MTYVRDYMTLRAEFQTLQRLPKSNHIFFTCGSLLSSLTRLQTIRAVVNTDLMPIAGFGRTSIVSTRWSSTPGVPKRWPLLCDGSTKG
jgi:hypothetical protein